MSSYTYGLFGEEVAKNYFTNMGFNLIANRYKTPYGELDLVLIKNIQILFVEVKTRKKLSDISEILQTKQILRNKHAAEIFLSKHLQYSEFECRFDLIIVKDSKVEQHLENITQ